MGDGGWGMGSNIHPWSGLHWPMQRSARDCLLVFIVDVFFLGGGVCVGQNMHHGMGH